MGEKDAAEAVAAIFKNENEKNDTPEPVRRPSVRNEKKEQPELNEPVRRPSVRSDGRKGENTEVVKKEQGRKDSKDKEKEARKKEKELKKEKKERKKEKEAIQKVDLGAPPDEGTDMTLYA